MEGCSVRNEEVIDIQDTLQELSLEHSDAEQNNIFFDKYQEEDEDEVEFENNRDPVN